MILFQLVQEQTPVGYESVEKLLQYNTDRYEAALEIQVNKTEAKRDGWVITLESEKKVAVCMCTKINFNNNYGVICDSTDFC